MVVEKIEMESARVQKIVTLGAHGLGYPSECITEALKIGLNVRTHYVQVRHMRIDWR